MILLTCGNVGVGGWVAVGYFGGVALLQGVVEFQTGGTVHGVSGAFETFPVFGAVARVRVSGHHF